MSRSLFCKESPIFGYSLQRDLDIDEEYIFDIKYMAYLWDGTFSSNISNIWLIFAICVYIYIYGLFESVATEATAYIPTAYIRYIWKYLPYVYIYIYISYLWDGTFFSNISNIWLIFAICVYIYIYGLYLRWHFMALYGTVPIKKSAPKIVFP